MLPSERRPRTPSPATAGPSLPSLRYPPLDYSGSGRTATFLGSREHPKVRGFLSWEPCIVSTDYAGVSTHFWMRSCMFWPERLFPLGHHFPRFHLTMIPIAISRVNQFDAARLDVEMSAMLKEQLVKVFSLMKPGLLFQYEPELDAFLEFLIWRFSIWVDKPTPGNALMNLRYRDERAAPIAGKEVRTGLEGPGLSVSQKILYCISTVGGQYLLSRLQSFSAFRRWGDSEQRPLAHRAWGLVQHAEGLYRAVSFFNLLSFLYGGRYKTIVERILKARLVYGSPNMNRAVSFEYMNRQLVWNEFSEMLLLLLPLLNSSSVKKFLLPFSKDKSASSSGDEANCPICVSSPSIPFVALPCQHRYCYYCLRTRCAATSSYRCARCNEVVVAIQRYGSS